MWRMWRTRSAALTAKPLRRPCGGVARLAPRSDPTQPPTLPFVHNNMLPPAAFFFLFWFLGLPLTIWIFLFSSMSKNPGDFCCILGTGSDFVCWVLLILQTMLIFLKKCFFSIGFYFICFVNFNWVFGDWYFGSQLLVVFYDSVAVFFLFAAPIWWFHYFFCYQTVTCLVVLLSFFSQKTKPIWFFFFFFFQKKKKKKAPFGSVHTS